MAEKRYHDPFKDKVPVSVFGLFGKFIIAHDCVFVNAFRKIIRCNPLAEEKRERFLQKRTENAGRSDAFSALFCCIKIIKDIKYYLYL